MDADPSSLACLALTHVPRRRMSRPGRHLVALDVDEGMFARRARDGVEECNVGIEPDGSGWDWLALRDIGEGEEIVFDTGDFVVVGSSYEEEDEGEVVQMGGLVMGQDYYFAVGSVDGEEDENEDDDDNDNGVERTRTMPQIGAVVGTRPSTIG
jgi:hypothetical protein